jgi:hypothetical protein
VDETSRVEVMNELTAKILRLEELCSWLEGPGIRICSLLLSQPPGIRLEELYSWLDGLTISRRQSGSLRWHMLSYIRWTLSFRPCGRQLPLFGTWYWAMPMVHPR